MVIDYLGYKARVSETSLAVIGFCVVDVDINVVVVLKNEYHLMENILGISLQFSFLAKSEKKCSLFREKSEKKFLLVKIPMISQKFFQLFQKMELEYNLGGETIHFLV